MHYYKRNLGDYAKKAGRLSMLQHGAYNLLIDACFDREVFPTLEQAIDWAWASSDIEIEAVKFVLNRFFILNENGQYVQHEILEQILNYQENASINKRIAIERETKRKEKNTNRVPSVNEPPPNHKPITINQEPITNNHKPVKTISSDCSNRFDVFWNTYPKKVGKEAARKSFLKMVKTQSSFDEVLKALSWQTKSDQWLKDGGQFIPNPATYLNQGRWQDEPESKKQSKSGGFNEKDYGETGLL